MSKTFCIVPWRELYSTTIGTFRMCCVEDESKENSHRQTPIDQGIMPHWNSEYMREARLNFLSGKKMPQCDYCWSNEARGKISRRQRLNQRYSNSPEIDNQDDLLEIIRDETAEDGSTDLNIDGIFISVGNICQLRCIHCSPAYSNSVGKDYDRLGWHPDFKTRRIITIDNFVNDQKSFDQHHWPMLRSISKKIKFLGVTGGEPSLSKGLLEYMTWLDDQGLAKDIIFYSNTNAVNVKQPWIDAMSKFKKVILKFSVDGVGPVDDYLRFPGKWDKKVEIMTALSRQFPGAFVQTSVHALNLVNLPEIIEFVSKLPVIHEINSVQYPSNLNPKNLPQEIKHSVIAQLQHYLTDYHGYMIDSADSAEAKKYFQNNLAGLIELLERPGDPQEIAEIRSIISAYDSIRPMRLASLLPQLENL